MSRGHERERKVKRMLEAEGWFVVRAAGSFGLCDLICLHPSEDAMLVEVKSTIAGPYAHFGPADRAALIQAAERSGAEAWLCYWPPRQREPTWISSEEFPETEAAA